ncbi:MAG: hypothetical protein ACI4PE_02565 [Bacilli bacterium]
MAVKKDVKEQVKQKNPTRQKIIVEQGRSFGTPYVPYKVLYTEVVSDKENAKVRMKELNEEYKNTDALSIHYFSL